MKGKIFVPTEIKMQTISILNQFSFSVTHYKYFSGKSKMWSVEIMYEL